MAGIAAIRTAKDTFNEHCTNHRCRQGECDTRRELWLAYMREAEIWGGYKIDYLPFQGYL